MPSGVGNDTWKIGSLLVSGSWRHDGKWIRRRLERQFDENLARIVDDDPQVVRQQPHARWLLDNSHLVRQTLQQIETDLPKNYYRQLASVDVGDHGATPRIFTLVDEALEQSGLPIEQGALREYFEDYQEYTSVCLSLG